MPKYEVTVKYIYSDTVDVEAKSKEEAERIALQECEEEPEILHDVIINEVD
jgi:hypothetical protein